ncbi:predicted protein [Chaetoceros tenuissimus]|uniref:Uncharacterized protein n=1 Tax=Chaetoceros tenuissimus TaxID=426638 RepID=A0AAD3CGB5_9STRA|nr:predicted protein [Chaetoceros tenuissimus]
MNESIKQHGSDGGSSHSDKTIDLATVDPREAALFVAEQASLKSLASNSRSNPQAKEDEVDALIEDPTIASKDASVLSHVSRVSKHREEEKKLLQMVDGVSGEEGRKIVKQSVEIVDLEEEALFESLDIACGVLRILMSGLFLLGTANLHPSLNILLPAVDSSIVGGSFIAGLTLYLVSTFVDFYKSRRGLSFFIDATAQIGIWILLIGSVFVLDDITVDVDKAGQTAEGDFWYPITLFKDSSAVCFIIGFAIMFATHTTEFTVATAKMEEEVDQGDEMKPGSGWRLASTGCASVGALFFVIGGILSLSRIISPDDCIDRFYEDSRDFFFAPSSSNEEVLEQNAPPVVFPEQIHGASRRMVISGLARLAMSMLFIGGSLTTHPMSSFGKTSMFGEGESGARLPMGLCFLFGSLLYTLAAASHFATNRSNGPYLMNLVSFITLCIGSLSLFGGSIALLDNEDVMVYDIHYPTYKVKNEVKWKTHCWLFVLGSSILLVSHVFDGLTLSTSTWPNKESTWRKWEAVSIFFAVVGAIFFIVASIFSMPKTEETAISEMNPEVDSEFVLRYYGERSAFFITGSVFYMLHALLYIFPRVIYCVEPNEADRLERNKNRSLAYVSGISRCVMSACFLSGAGYFFSSETEKILYNTEDRAASFILIGTAIFVAAVATDKRVFKPDPASIFGIIIMLVGSIFLFSNSNRDLGLNQKDQQDVPGIVIAVGSAVLLIGQLWKTRVMFQMSELVHYSLKLTCIFFESMGTLFFMLGESIQQTFILFQMKVPWINMIETDYELLSLK